MRFAARGVFGCALLLLLVAGAARAQTDNPSYANLQFNLTNPGARSLALGGAFAALADDATAAYANPAGLTQLPKLQVSLEIRDARTDVSYSSGGCYLAACAQPFERSTVSGGTTRPSFLSVIYPKGRWALAAYRHELADFSFSALTNRITAPGNYLASPTEYGTRLRITNWGASAAYNVNDNFALGLGVSYYRNALENRTTLFAAKDPSGEANQSAPPVASVNEGAARTSAGGNVGFLLHAGKASFGGAYRRVPAFSFATTSVVRGQAASSRAHFDVPDTFSLGFAYRFTQTLYVSTEIQQLQYRQLTEHLVTDFSQNADIARDATSYEAKNGREIRVGLERAFLRPTGDVLAVRLGGWSEPGHAIEYRGAFLNAQAQFRPASSRNHLTGGLGVTFRSSWQFDAAIDRSRGSTLMSLSVVKQF